MKTFLHGVDREELAMLLTRTPGAGVPVLRFGEREISAHPRNGSAPGSRRWSRSGTVDYHRVIPGSSPIRG